MGFITMAASKKLPASALISTLIISLILFISCSMVLLGLYHFKYFQVNDEISERLTEDIESGIIVTLNDTALYHHACRDSFLLFQHQPDSVYLTRELWGLFPSASLTVAYKGRKKQKDFLYGAADYLYNDAVLYLADHDRPLSLAGETYIRGKAYIPRSGMRSGFFDQKGFSRKKLIEGITDSSKKELPAIAPGYTRYFNSLSQLFLKAAGFQTLTEDINNSFSHSAQYYKTSSRGILSNRSVKGKVVIVSDSILEIDHTSRLQDIILVAPYIHFKEGFKGVVQAFCLDSLTIDSNCLFLYPSALVGLGRTDSLGKTGATVTVHKDSRVEGIVLALTETGIPGNIKPVVKIKRGAIVRGLVFNKGYTYLNGNIEGAIYTDFFFEQRGPMSMENMLIDVSVTESIWLKNGNCFSIFKDATKHQLIKWLE